MASSGPFCGPKALSSQPHSNDFRSCGTTASEFVCKPISRRRMKQQVSTVRPDIMAMYTVQYGSAQCKLDLLHNGLCIGRRIIAGAGSTALTSVGSGK